MTPAATVRASALLLAAVAMAALFAASGFTASAQTGPVEKNCTPPASEGEWIIEGTHVVCVGQDITVTRIKVWKASTLELHDVNLYLNSNIPSGGGSISIGYDVEGYAISSKLHVRDSYIEDLAPEYVSTGSDGISDEGISVGSNGIAEVSDSTIWGLHHGVTIHSWATRVEVTGSTFTNIDFGITDFGGPNVVIQDNFFDQVESPIYTQGTPVIQGNTIVNCKNGIELKFDAAHPIVRENTITACGAGIGQTQSQSPQEGIYHNDVFGNCNPHGGGGNLGVHGKAESNWWGASPPGPEELNAKYKCVVEPSNPTPADYSPWLTSPRHPERLPTPAIASLPSSVVRGESISFDASGSQPSTDFGFPLESYEWSLGDGTSLSGEQVTHAYQDLGSYTVKLTVKDEKGLGHFTQRTVQVVNQEPSVSVALSSGYAGEDVIAAIDASDPDGDSLSTQIEWFRNGVKQALTSGSVPGNAVKSMDEWMVRVLVEDGFGGQDEATASVQIPNRAPTVNPDLLPTSPNAGDQLNVESGAQDPDGDSLSLSYEWKRDGQVQSSQTESSLSGSQVQAGDAWTVTVTATDPHGATSQATRSVTIGNRAPAITSLTLSPSTPTTESTLEAIVQGNDPDGQSVSYQYEWHRDGVVQDLTSAQVPSDRVAKGESWVVTVTPTDGLSDGSSRQATVVIGNTAPVVQSATSSPSTVGVGESVVLRVSASDVDQDVLAVTWTLPDGSTHSGSQVAASFQSSGQKSVAYEVSDGTAKRSGQLTVTVEAPQTGSGSGTETGSTDSESTSDQGTSETDGSGSDPDSMESGDSGQTGSEEDSEQGDASGSESTDGEQESESSQDQESGDEEQEEGSVTETGDSGGTGDGLEGQDGESSTDSSLQGDQSGSSQLHNSDSRSEQRDAPGFGVVFVLLVVGACVVRSRRGSRPRTRR